MTIYRNVNTPGYPDYYPLPNATDLPMGTTTVTDDTPDSTLITNFTNNKITLNMNGALSGGPTAALTMDPATNTPVAGNLTGTYQYYVTFFNDQTNVESRPQLVATTSPTLAGNSVTLSNFPPPTSGTWTSERIYRNTNDTPGDTNYYEIADIPIATATAGGYTFVDNYSDASIQAGGMAPVDSSDQVPAGSNILNFNGPPVTASTLLQNVVEYNASSGTYSNLFPLPAPTATDTNPTATLSFTGIKGGSTLTTQTLTITDTSNLKDLADFMQGALGIQSPTSSNSIPVDSVSGLPAGVTITSDGKIQIVSNDGVAEATSVDLSSLQLTSGGATSNVDLPFNQTQAAVGQGTTTSFTAYDSLGTPLPVTITAVLEKVDSSYTIYRWYADCGENDPVSGAQQGIAVGTGTVTFNGEGNCVSASNTTVSIGRAHEPSVKPLDFNLDFSQVSGLAASTPSLSVASQDGSAPGVLNSFNISATGLISGVFSNGISQDLGQIQLARFTNPAGLEQVGQNMYTTGVNSGLPIPGDPGEGGNGTIVAGSLELSNTDIGGSLINLITTSTMYQANTRVITTATQLFDDLLQLGR